MDEKALSLELLNRLGTQLASAEGTFDEVLVPRAFAKRIHGCDGLLRPAVDEGAEGWCSFQVLRGSSGRANPKKRKTG